MVKFIDQGQRSRSPGQKHLLGLLMRCPNKSSTAVKEARKGYDCEAYDVGCTQSVCNFILRFRSVGINHIIMAVPIPNLLHVLLIPVVVS